METEVRKVLNVSLAIMVCMRISEDLCTEMFNKPMIKEKNRKADILMTYESFKKIEKRMRINMGKDEFVAKQDEICQCADELEPYVKLIRNEFYSISIRQFKYEHTECIALGMTINAIIAVADEMFRKMYGYRAKMIDEILHNLDRFGMKFKVKALNELPDNDIDTKSAEPHLQAFINKLLEKTTTTERK